MAATILTYLNNIKPALDIDGNGVVDASTDGLMILRKLFGLTGNAVTNGALGPGATRTPSQIDAYLLGLMPP